MILNKIISAIDNGEQTLKVLEKDAELNLKGFEQAIKKGLWRQVRKYKNYIEETMGKIARIAKELFQVMIFEKGPTGLPKRILNQSDKVAEKIASLISFFREKLALVQQVCPLSMLE